VNALKSGLGAVLLQELVPYASRAMTVLNNAVYRLKMRKKKMLAIF